EVGTSLRLLERVLKAYPRAFEVVLADSLYAQARFINFLLGHRKHALIVMKQERRDLYQDALGLFKAQQPVAGNHTTSQCQWWDEEGFSSWPGLLSKLRVVRSLETRLVRRQASTEIEKEESEWVWVTTIGKPKNAKESVQTNLPKIEATTSTVVKLGHARWDIENQGFNQLVNSYEWDHVYKHDERAIEAFCLEAMLAVNLLLAFLRFNIKGGLRNLSKQCWGRILSAEIHIDLVGKVKRAPS